MTEARQQQVERALAAIRQHPGVVFVDVLCDVDLAESIRGRAGPSVGIGMSCTATLEPALTSNPKAKLAVLDVGYSS